MAFWSSATSLLGIVRRRWRTMRLRRRIFYAVGAPMTLAFLAINAIAYMQARAMLHFVDGGTRTARPESLSLGQKLGILFTGVRIPRPANDANPADFGLDFQIVRFGGQHADDCEGWFIPCQNPKALCIGFHGYTSSKQSLLLAARAFHDLGYNLLLVDFRGSGGSRGSSTTVGYEEAIDVASAVDFARAHDPVQPIILYGQSMGGAAILRAISDLSVHPAAIIIESTFDTLLSTTQNRFRAMGIPSFPLAELVLFWGGVQEGHNAFRQNPADYARRVSCPVLMFQGSADARVTNAQAWNLFDHLAGPKQLEIFDQCGHCKFLTNDHQRWTADVNSFLDAIPRPPQI